MSPVPMRLRKPFLVLAGMLTILASARVVSALPFVLIDDQYDSTVPSIGTSVSAGNSFTSNAAVGGIITYTVNAGTIGVGFFPGLNFFGGAETVGDLFTTVSTNPGQLYEVNFDLLLIGESTSHTIDVGAYDGVGVVGAFLAGAGPLGVNTSGGFLFTAVGTSTTIRMLGALGSPNGSSDIAFDNFEVSTNPVPEPASLLLLAAGLAAGARRLRKSRR